MTQKREEEREKRRSHGQSDSPISPHTAHGSTSGSPRSPLRKTQSTVKITVSPTVSAAIGTDDRAKASHEHSSDGTPFHSARHSPVSEDRVPERALSSACSPTSFVTAYEVHDGVSYFTLSDADGAEQKANGTVSSLPARKSTELRARSSAAGNQAKMTRLAAPKLSLRVSRPSAPSTDRKPPFVIGSATGSSSGSAPSLSRSSQIPRATGESSLKPGSKACGKVPLEEKGKAPLTGSMGTVKRETNRTAEPQDVPLPKTPTTASAVRHVKTLNSTGTTPIISRETLEKRAAPDKHAIVTSYLETIERSVPDNTPTPLHSQEPDPTAFSRSIAEKLSRPMPSHASSRVTSSSTVKAVPLVNPMLLDTAIISCRKGSNASGMRIGNSSALSNTYHQAVEMLPGALPSPVRGRSSEYVPRDRKQNRSDLSATAAEFVPRKQENSK